MVNRKGIRYTDEQRDKMRAAAAEAYEDGAWPGEIAAQLGCSLSSVRIFLAKAGIVERRDRRRPTLPEGMLTSGEAAALIGVKRESLSAMQHRGEGPPRAEPPRGAHGHYTYYWRVDVETWLRERGERRLQRLHDRIDRQREKAETVAAAAGPDYALDWEALMQAVNEKRAAHGLTWATVCHLTGTDQGHMSRIRKGQAPTKGLGTFARLAFWVAGSIPDEIGRFTREQPGPGLTSVAS